VNLNTIVRQLELIIGKPPEEILTQGDPRAVRTSRAGWPEVSQVSGAGVSDSAQGRLRGARRFENRVRGERKTGGRANRDEAIGNRGFSPRFVI